MSKFLNLVKLIFLRFMTSGYGQANITLQSNGFDNDTSRRGKHGPRLSKPSFLLQSDRMKTKRANLDGNIVFEKVKTLLSQTPSEKMKKLKDKTLYIASSHACSNSKMEDGGQMHPINTRSRDCNLPTKAS